MNEIKCFPFVFTKDLYNKIVQNKKTVTRRLERKRVAEGDGV